MNNFGVIELASTKTTNAPGWAYVPDSSTASHHHHHLSSSAAAAPSRKRARNQPAALSAADADARQEAKARRELDVLDRDNARDVAIAVPPKAKDNSSSGGGGGYVGGGRGRTANVRKILQSQKTFANHLDDYRALVAQSEGNPHIAALLNHGAGGSGGGAAAGGSGGVGSARTAPSARKGATNKRASLPASTSTPTATAPPSRAREKTAKNEASGDVADTDMPDAESQLPPPPPRSAILTPPPRLPPSHPLDGDPLLVSHIPQLPPDATLGALVSSPPLSYLDARSAWSADIRKYPGRVFCSVCGYWGRVRCSKCGTRVCALECLETHREECVTRYGL
ncbi:hypothetical protein F5Y15DRAFT_13532 [Xylariaceae sp. FL0016]|nr:hypothetical protein F5Y15DRAFT_13532 [Xylariaceae sp. FL0016]